MNAAAKPSGMRGFVVIWAGQLVSQLGNAMGWFAFSLWAWKATGAASTLALVQLFAFAPALLLSPLAGVLADRWNKKLVLALADLGTALATLAVLLIYRLGALQVWHLYAAAVFAGAFIAFQFPAYSTTTLLMLRPQEYARAEAMLGLTQSIPGILAPMLAAWIMSRYGFGGVMVIDLLTFLAAFATLVCVFIPKTITQAPRFNFREELLSGFRYIFQRRALAALVILFIGGNFFEGIGITLVAPMVLAHTSNNAFILGRVESLGAFGGILGGGLVSLLGGPKRRLAGIVLGWASAFSLGLMLMGLGSGWVTWAAGYFCFSFFMIVVNSSEQALWQSKVNPQMQGRVAATRLLLIQIPYLLAYPLAGYLADRVFEPALAGGGMASIGWLAGQGTGSGISLLVLLAGMGGALTVAIGYSFRLLRRLENNLPDFDGQPPIQTEGAVQASSL